MRRSILIPIALVIAAAVPNLRSAWAVGEDFDSPAPVDLQADDLSYDQARGLYRATGGVVLRKGNLTLLTESLQFDSTTQEAQALGEVELSDPEAVVEADRIDLNLRTEQGTLVNGRILLKERNFRIGGELIHRLGENDYQVHGGTFTTCSAVVPDWKFGAKRLDVQVGGYARARHAVFYIRDIPVLYTPYFFYPVKTERESGFLTPNVGSSSKRGTQFSLAWYQVIARNQDATFFLDYLSKMGVGKGVEYRYIFGTLDAGELQGYHISGFDEHEDRYAFDWEHQGTLPARVRLSADVEYVSHRDYFEDFGQAAEEYNKDKAQSVVAFSRSWQRASLITQFKYTKELEYETDTTLQKLPEVVFTAIRQPIFGGPFYLALDASSTYFWREEGVRGQRLTARPELSAVFAPWDLLEIRPEVGYRERLYWTSDEGPGYEDSGIPDFTLRLSSRLRRVFTLDEEGRRKVQHSVTPEVTYRYVPEKDQSDLPHFDLLDRIEAENHVRYSLINRLTSRSKGDGASPVYHEFLYLRLSQSYFLSDPSPTLQRPYLQDESFSPVEAELIVRPTALSFLDLETAYETHSGEDAFLDRFPLLNVSGGLRDGTGNGISLEYRYRREGQDYLDGTVDLAWLHPLYLNYRHRYDLDSDRSLEQVLNLEYRSQCWSVFLTVRDRLEDTEYLLSFALSGLGRVADFGGSLGGNE